MLSAEERQRRIEIIRAYPLRLRALVADLTEEQLTTPYLEGEWTVAQNVHHLPDSHMNSVIRLKLILTEDHPPLKGYDQDAWALLADVESTPIEASLTLLTGLHERWANLFARLTDEQRQRVGIHSEIGEVTPDDLLVTYSDHCDAHIDQIERTLAAADRA